MPTRVRQELLPSAALFADETGPFQNGDVLLHGREAHRIGLGQPRDRQLPAHAAAQYVPARGVGQGVEQPVHRLVVQLAQLIYNHLVVR
jgi:hypothetical protein